MKSLYLKKLITALIVCTVSLSASATQICGKNTHSCRDEHNGSYKCCKDSNKHHQYQKKKQHKSSSSN